MKSYLIEDIASLLAGIKIYARFKIKIFARLRIQLVSIEKIFEISIGQALCHYACVYVLRGLVPIFVIVLDCWLYCISRNKLSIGSLLLAKSKESYSMHVNHIMSIIVDPGGVRGTSSGFTTDGPSNPISTVGCSFFF